MSKEQSSFIKGLGILLIMIHNFVDILLGISCNEMYYSSKATDAFLANLFTAESIWYVFSFAGWVGVAIFFFVSGYGLTKKYSNTSNIKNGTYIKSHIIKLWKLMVPIFIVYFAIYHTNLQSALAQISFTINFLSYRRNSFFIDPGVYWFFGAILQFYLLFLILRKLNTRWLWVLFVVFLAIQYCIVYAVGKDLSNWMRHNFIGWGAPFLLGMIAARSQLNISKKLNTALCIASFLGYCVCLITKCLAPFTEIFTIVLFVSLSRIVAIKWICFVGVISPSIFALHPLIRQLFYSIFDSAPNYPYTMTIAFVITTILFSWAHHVILARTDKLIK